MLVVELYQQVDNFLMFYQTDTLPRNLVEVLHQRVGCRSLYRGCKRSLVHTRDWANLQDLKYNFFCL